MRKYLLIIITSFFLFTSSVFANQLNSLEREVTIHEDGSATIVDTIGMMAQKDSNFEIDFLNVKDAKISNISLTDRNNTTFVQTDKLVKGKYFFYTLADEGYKKFIRISALSEDNFYCLKYDISNISVKYSDGLYGIDWFAATRIAGESISTLNVTIAFEDSKLFEQIDQVNTIGIKDASSSLVENKISISVKNVDSGDNLRILVTFNKGVTFKNAVERKKTYAEFYDDAANGRDFEVLFNSYSSKGFLIGFSIIVEIGVIVLILSWIIIRYGTHDEYYGMEVAGKKPLPKIKEAPFYDSVPCQGDLYKLFFVGGYFKILKNKSDFIGAILFKMYLNDNIEIVNGKAGKDMRLRNDLKIDRSLDQDLYNIMMEASDMRVVSASKTNKFAKTHFLRLMTWYNMGYSETITDEINRGHATRGGKIGKTTKIVFNDVFYDYGVKILGMKKYLLNFNQVPRQTALSEDTYKLLLISAEMLGIGKQVAEEILRKNPNNIYAKKLLEFQDIKPIFHEIYGLALSAYRQTVKNNEIYNYDSMKDASLQSTNVIVFKG